MNQLQNNPCVFQISHKDLLKLKKIPSPSFTYPTQLIFNPTPYILEDSEKPEFCSYYLNGNCKFSNKCKNYHPHILDDSECLLCKAKVRSSLRKFGLLTGCDDTFCYPCIRQWRSRGNVSSEIASSCPICGKTSRSLAASSILPTSSHDKIDLIKYLLAKSPFDNL